MSDTVFGEIWDAGILEDDMTAFLQKWFKTYSAEIAEQRGHDRGRYEPPKFWTTTPVLTPDVVKQIRYPAVLVVSSGLASQPTKRSANYEAPYAVGVTIMTTGTSEINSSRMAKRYGAAVRAAVVQKGGLETDYIEGIAWTDERFTDFLAANQESVSSATEIFNVTVKDITKWKGAGPAVPDPLPEDPGDPSPYPPNPTVRDPESDPPYDPVTVTNTLGGS